MQKQTFAFSWVHEKQAGYASYLPLIVILIVKLHISQLNKTAGGLIESVDQLDGMHGNCNHYLITGFISNRLQHGDLFLVTDVTENRGSIVLHLATRHRPAVHSIKKRFAGLFLYSPGPARRLWVTIDPKQMSGGITVCLDISVADTDTYPSRSALDNCTILNV